MFIKSADTNKCIDLSCKGNTDSLPYYLGLIVFLCLVTHQKNKKNLQWVTSFIYSQCL